MLSFTKTHLSFLLLSFLLYIAGLVASAPIPGTYHRRQIDPPFPYGKLGDKMLNVNDVSYMIDDREEDRILVYPDYPTPFSDALPAIIPKPPILPSTIPKVDTKSVFSFVHRIPHIIQQVVPSLRNAALGLSRTMQRSKTC